jgi:Uma2 family endonuclease
MSSVQKSINLMSVEEYLAWEREQVEKHEYYGGEVFSQAGGTRRHSLVGSNLLRSIGNVLVGHPCEVHGSDMRVHIKANDSQVYPDVSIVCPPIEADTNDVISNPVLVAEVLSPSTADFDRGTKFGHYRLLPSLREYLVLWQDEARAEHHVMQEAGVWVLKEIVGLDQTLDLASIGKSILMSDVYDKVQFE